MNNLNLKGHWNEIKGKIKKEYANLTDNDLAYTEGKEDELYGRLQQKLGKTKDEIKDIFNKMITPAVQEAKKNDEKEEVHGRKVVDHNKVENKPPRRG